MLALADVADPYSSASAASSGTTTTTAGNAVWQVISFPFRIVTAVSSGALGMVGGAAKGVVTTEEKFATNTFGKADDNPLMVVPGVLGTVVAVPAGIVVGAPQGLAKGAVGGYTYWDTFY